MVKPPPPPRRPTDAELQKRADAIRFIAERRLYNKMEFFGPYEKQKLFHELGRTKRERLLMAGNRVGKTECGAFEMSCHLTGNYPEWWVGRKFPRPVKAWAASDTGTTTRDVVQSKLCGPYGYPAKYGTGMLPRDNVDWKNDVSLARGVTDLFDTVLVTHRTAGKIDGKSVLTFKTYEQGRKKWQGEAVDVIWDDEEPEMDVYTEGLARLAPTNPLEEGGICYVTFTPLLGRSEVVRRYTDETSVDRALVKMSMDDALHLGDAESRRKILDGYPAHQRDAREKGIPLLGQGAVFTALQESIREARLPGFPAWWHYLWGTDFGIGHPFAAALIGWDKDADIIHIMHTIRMTGAKPIEHAAAMKAYFPLAPVAWPHDGTAREKSGEVVSTLYKKAGLHMLPEHATFAEGGYGTEAGVLEMETRFLTGRMKVASHLSDFFEEYGFYHRKDGLIVKKDDDLLSATRIAVMMRRKAKQLDYLDNTFGGGVPKVQIAVGIDDDPWG